MASSSNPKPPSRPSSRASKSSSGTQKTPTHTTHMSTSTQKLAGKVAVVTGASKGIGAAIAKAFAAEGASVVVNYASSKAGADKTVDEIFKAGGKAVAVG